MGDKEQRSIHFKMMKQTFQDCENMFLPLAFLVESFLPGLKLDWKLGRKRIAEKETTM
ncbi:MULTISPECIES: hypothetical protein [Sediminibacillus]|uniref:hypothetical protein n=1 Tax=Sediminibacillus TaxID=482460 RepID=UPI0012977FCB|nr:hypothetical protein [Sediminibacillus terrae]